MKKDACRSPARPGNGENAGGVKLADLFGAFFQHGAEAMHILGRTAPQRGRDLPGNTGAIMPPAPREPEEETG